MNDLVYESRGCAGFETAHAVVHPCIRRHATALHQGFLTTECAEHCRDHHRLLSELPPEQAGTINVAAARH
eukprot:15443245-Alexandrium_andersonii.AAC.1